MDTHPRYTLVGMIVVIIIALLTLWISWLWKGGSKEKSDFYAIYFRNQSLSGLQIDSIVTMRGIKVGSVKTVAIQPKDIERVRVSIALNHDTPIRTDTRAVIARNLLTGLASIDLIGSTQSALPLTHVPEQDEFAVIKEGQTGLDQFQQSVPELVGKASIALDRIALLLSEKNIEAFSHSLENVEKASAGLKEVGTVINSADQSFNQLSEVLKEAKGKVAPTLDDFAATIKEVKLIVSGLSAELTILTRSLTTTSQKLSEPRSALLGLSSGELGPGEKAEK